MAELFLGEPAYLDIPVMSVALTSSLPTRVSIPWRALKTSSHARRLFLMDFKVKRVQKMITWANKRELNFSYVFV